MSYKINEVITIYYLAKNNQTGIVDLLLTPINPNDISQSSIVFSELGAGLYKACFYPDEIGEWYVKISSISYPINELLKSYRIEIQKSIFENDVEGNTMPSDINLANFEEDENGDLMPLSDITDFDDKNFEIDSNSDIEPKE